MTAIGNEGLDECFSLDDGGGGDGVSSDVCVGHGLAHSLHQGGGGGGNHGGNGGGHWGGLDNWSGGGVGGGVGKTVVTIEVVVVVVSEWMSIGIVSSSSSVGSVVVAVAVVQVESISVSLGLSLSLWLSLSLGDPGGGDVSEGGGGGAGQESGLHGAPVGSDAVGGGQADRSGGGGEGVDERSERSSVDLVGHHGGGVDHSLHHRSVVDSAGCWQHKWSDGGNWSWSNSKGSSNWSWSSNKGSGNWDWDSLAHRVNKSVLVDVLRESLQRDGSEAALSGDEVPEGGGQRSGHWAVIDIGGGQGQLGVSLGLSLVQTVDRLVTGAGQRPSIAGGVVRSVEVGVAVGGVVVQRICFRLSQDKRGYGENSDLKEV